MRDIDTLIVHHSASDDVSANTIRQWHLNRGWRDIGYHLVIRESGDIELGRPIDQQGAHAKGRNADSVGICLTGEFNKYSPTIEQINSLIKVTNGLITNYNINNIEKHHEKCPGKLFPWGLFIKNIKED